MTTRVITTASSVWTFDLDAETYTRVPRVEGDDHPNIPYEDSAIPFTDLLPYGDRMIVLHPDGRLPVYTGTVQSDVTETVAPPRRVTVFADLRVQLTIDAGPGAAPNPEVASVFEDELKSCVQHFFNDVLTPAPYELDVQANAYATSAPIPREEN